MDSGGTIVLYMDGTCESLEYAIEMRKEKKDLSLPQFRPVIDTSNARILKAAYFKTTVDTILLTYFVESLENHMKYLIYFKIDAETLRLDGPVNRLRLFRDEAQIDLSGFTVVDSTSCPQLVTICKQTVYGFTALSIVVFILYFFLFFFFLVFIYRKI